jgi:sensor domain CHASE-containing protein
VAVSGLRVPAELHQQVDEVGRLATRRVVERRLLRLGRIHVGA